MDINVTPWPCNGMIRLPSAMDNRPLKFEEFETRRGQTVYVSATPGEYELELAGGEVVEQLVRPTGLVDPAVVIRPVEGQVDDLLGEIRKRVEAGQRTLVTTLTKRMAEDLTEYYRELGVRVEYLHSEVLTLERVRILRDLRKGVFDVLVGVNLLREGLDLPEVSLVAILDADKEGFLRSTNSLIQTIGRAARHLEGQAILYADVMTGSMQRSIDETYRRRKLQAEYNQKHGITPETIQKAIHRGIESEANAHAKANAAVGRTDETVYITEEYLSELEEEMLAASQNLDFEQAAAIRDRIEAMRESLGQPVDSVRERGESYRGKKKGRSRRKASSKEDGSRARGKVPRDHLFMRSSSVLN